MRNDLHPERIVRRLRINRPMLLDSDHCPEVPRIVEYLRSEADHQEWNAALWEKGETDIERIVAANLEHVAAHCRRIARRLRETADAIEREHAAGPWIGLDQPFVHLDAEAH